MSEFLDVALWIWDLLVMQLLPFASMVLLIIGLFGVINRLPDTITNYAKAQGARISKAFGKKR